MQNNGRSTPLRSLATGLEHIPMPEKISAARTNDLSFPGNSLGLMIANHTNVMLIYWDKNGICQFSNCSFCKWVGKTCEDMVGKMSIRELLGAELFEKNRQFIEGALAGRQQVFDREISDASGETRYYAASYSPHIENGEVLGFFAEVADITSRKKAERLLRERNEILERIFETTHFAMVYLDLNFNFIRVNKSYADSCGHPPEFFPGKNHFDLYPGEEVECIFRKVASTGSPFTIYARPFEFPDHPEWGVTYWDWSLYPTRNDKGAIEGLLFILLDVTNNVKSAEALRESEEKFRLVFQDSPLGISLTSLEGDFIPNKAFCNMIGYSEKELLNLNFQKITHPDDLEKSHALTELFLKREITNASYIKRYIHKNGDVIYAELNTTLQEGDNGKPPFFITTVNDITDRKKAEDALTLSQKKLIDLTNHLENVREKERKEIALDLHDHLGQKLTALNIDLHWINKKLSTENAAVREKISSMMEQVNDTISTVKDLSMKLRPSILDDLGLMAAIEWYVNDFHNRTGIECNMDLFQEETGLRAEMEINVFRIVQEAFTNIARHSQATHVNFIAKKKGHSLLITIADNGKGFPESVIAETNAFGIYGMKERALMCKGKIEVSSQTGEGTIINLSIPLNSAV